MSESKRFGPVQAHFNDDGTLSIYQPDANRQLSPELAQALVAWLNDNSNTNLIHPGLESDYYAQQSTVGGGVISTSEGPAPAWDEAELELLSDSEREADLQAAEARAQLVEESLRRGIADAEAGNVKPVPPSVLVDENTRIQDLRKIAKAAGLSAGGTKPELLKRLREAGNE